MSNHPLFNYAEHTANELRRMLDLQTKLDPSSMEYAQLMRNMAKAPNTAAAIEPMPTRLSIFGAP